MAAKDSGPGWRQGNKRPAGAAQAPGGGKRDWQRRAVADAGPRKPWSRRAKLGLAGGLLSVFALAVYVVILWLIPVKPMCLVLMGASYDVNLAVPHNVYGCKNLDELNNLTKETEVFTTSGKPDVRVGNELKAKSAWEKEWSTILKNNPISQKSVVVFLALHGAVDSKGNPFFYVGGENGYEALPFTDVVKTLRGEEFKEKNVLLLIEPALVRSNWSGGVLENKFAEALVQWEEKEKESTKNPHPNLYILCASGVDQTSWWSEEWQQTVFGHYVTAGLRGAAANDDDRVTIAQLKKVVTDKVSAWSQRNRGVEQIPIFLGDENAAAGVTIAQVLSTRHKENDAPISRDEAELTRTLQNAWSDWQSLRKMTPHPSVYSPALWRHYQELLVRYEQILRAGDTKRAADIKSRLDTLRNKVRDQASFEPQGPLTLALPMADALGVPLSLPKDELTSKIQEIWGSDKSDQREAAMKALVEWAKKLENVTLSDAQIRVQVYRAFLNFLCKNSHLQEKDHASVVEILDLIEVKLGQIRPAEANYVNMLFKFKDLFTSNPPDFEHVRDAIGIRVLAERAALGVEESAAGHPYSEILFPWNQKRIISADAARRPGEDLLFSSTKADWDKSKEFLKAAKNGYELVQNNSASYRKALDVRDRALAELPFYARWVANQRSSRKIDAWEAAVSDFSKRIGELNEALFQDKTGAPIPDNLLALATDVANQHDALRREMTEETSRLKPGVHDHSVWFDREAVLSVPPLPSTEEQDGADAISLRLILVENNRKLTAEFLKGKNELDKSHYDAQKEAKDSLRRNQQMVVAAFKPFWRDRLAGADKAGAKVSAKIEEVVSIWAGEVGDRVAKSFEQAQIPEAIEILREADFLSRGLPPGLDTRPDPKSASKELRALRIHKLLVAQAERTLLDHWSDDRDIVPYYEKAAKGYLEVAVQLAEANAETDEVKGFRKSPSAKMLAQLKKVGFSVVGDKDLYWTDQPEFKVKWTIVTDNDKYAYNPDAADTLASPPPAVAVTWRELKGSGKWKDGESAEKRKAVPLANGATHEFPQSFDLSKDSSNDDNLNATYKVHLRGQSKTESTRISRKEPDLVVYEFPKPEIARVKVRMAPDFTYGAVSIAVDISGSMVWIDEKKFGLIGANGVKERRLDAALRALGKTLSTIPEGTFVSLDLFVTPHNSPVPQVVQRRSPRPWKRTDVKDVIDLIEDEGKSASNSTGPTPMAYLLAKCASDGFPPKFRGPRVILALTDGDDTYSGTMLTKEGKKGWVDESSGSNKAVRNFVISEFNKDENKNIEIQFVCFLDEKTDGKYAAEYLTAKEQFEDAVKADGRGQFWVAPTAAELAETLNNALRPRLLMYKNDIFPPYYPKDGLIASLPDDPFVWKQTVPPGIWTTRVKDSPERNVRFAPGDMTALVLKRDPDSRVVTYERESYINSFGPKPLVEPALDGRFRVAVMQNNFTDWSKELTQAFAIEDTSTANQYIQQDSPKFVWIESAPKGQSPRKAGEESKDDARADWFREYGYPATMYRYLRSKWPRSDGVPATPDVKIWLTDDTDNPDFVVRTTGPKAGSVVKGKHHSVTIDGVDFEIKPIVATSDAIAGREKTSKECLIVRISYPENRPVYVQYTGANKGGSEHRYFHSAKQYTAMFWDVGEPNRDTASFNVIFLDAMKSSVPPVTFSVKTGSKDFEAPQKMGK